MLSNVKRLVGSINLADICCSLNPLAVNHGRSTGMVTSINSERTLETTRLFLRHLCATSVPDIIVIYTIVVYFGFVVLR